MYWIMGRCEEMLAIAHLCAPSLFVYDVALPMPRRGHIEAQLLRLMMTSIAEFFLTSKDAKLQNGVRY